MLRVDSDSDGYLNETLDNIEKKRSFDLQQYRNSCDGSIDAFLYYFLPILDARFDNKDRNGSIEFCKKIYGYLNTQDEQRYSVMGLKLLQSRYLLRDEPLQFCHARMALSLSKSPKTEWRIFYELISMGLIHLSSNFAKDYYLSTTTVYNGEACRLMVIKSDYDYEVLKQIQEINLVQSCGVGVGVNASNVSRFGIKQQGKIQSGFLDFLKSINYTLSAFNRKAKVAVYLHMHCDTIIDALTVKQMSNLHRLDNVFIGLLVNNLFLKKLEQNVTWYLFASDVTYKDRSLHEIVHLESLYEEAYEHLVRKKSYTLEIDATVLMERVVRSIATSGNPYIIWYDMVNKYNNVKHLGPIRTLNLCSEICNYTTDEEPSSCTLVTCNVGTIMNRFDRMKFIYDYCDKRYIDYDTLLKDVINHEYYEILKYTFTVGFMACVGLNNILGDRKKREIGIGPCGVFDAACCNGAVSSDERVIEFNALICEMLYKGSVYGSLWYADCVGITCQNWYGSEYSRGRFQFDLRGCKPRTDWNGVRELIKNGRTMANSLLTMQAPTASTSVLHGVCESVTLPLDVVSSRTCSNGTTITVPLGLSYLIRNKLYVNINTTVQQQLNIYKSTAPFVDHSQASTFHMECTGQSIYDLIMATRSAPGYELKTGIYYILPKIKATSLNIIHSERVVRKENNVPGIRDEKTSEDCGYDTTDTGCESCSM